MDRLAVVAEDLKLIGMGELMRMLGVSRTRAVQLSSDNAFPAPVVELMMGKVWRTADVRDWAQARGRTLLPLGAPSSSSGSTGDAKGSPRAQG